jgi:hypothetical protein
LPKSVRISPALRKRAAQIDVLLMDVDGTLTDGGVTLLSQTEEIALEIKTFDAHDGQASHWPTPPGFEPVALQDVKALRFFGAHAK